MSFDDRITRLERELDGVGPGEAVVIRVYRVPADLPDGEQDAWCAAHPEAVSKTVRWPRPAEEAE
jgi:hypothetical protein